MRTPFDAELYQIWRGNTYVLGRGLVFRGQPRAYPKGAGPQRSAIFGVQVHKIEQCYSSDDRERLYSNVYVLINGSGLRQDLKNTNERISSLTDW